MLQSHKPENGRLGQDELYEHLWSKRLVIHATETVPSLTRWT